VPKSDTGLPPTLGPAVVEWCEEMLCLGPGDVQGQPLVVDAEMRRFIYNAYELYPRGHALEGRRRVKQAVLSRPKGRSKTEIGATLACAEALGPVRFDGWDSSGDPVGASVTNPIIKCLATEAAQATNTYGVVTYMLENGQVADYYDLDVGITRTFVEGGGEIISTTSSGSSKDGGRETFVVADECHLWYTTKLKDLFSTMTRNIIKRRAADGWLLMTTTMHAPNEGSVAESLWDARESLDDLLYDHRQAPMDVDLSDDDQLRAALQYVYGAASSWINIEGIIQSEFRNPTKRESDSRRYFLNQPVTTENRFVAGTDWDACYVPEKILDSSVSCVLGFDGSFSGDYTAIVAVSIEEVPHVELIAIWEKPDGPAGLSWRVDIMDVMEVIRKTCKRLNVREVTADPHLWSMPLQILEEEGIPVTEFPQSSARMAPATKRLYDMIMSKTLTHSADATSPLRRHMINAHTKEDSRGFRLVKETDKSPNKIDAAVATVMALEVAEQSVDSAPQVYSIADMVYGSLAKQPERGTDTIAEPAPVPQQVFHSF